MSLIIVLSLLVCLLGLVIYLIQTGKGGVTEIARIMFFAGLLAFLFSGAQLGGCSVQNSGTVHTK